MQQNSQKPANLLLLSGCIPPTSQPPHKHHINTMINSKSLFSEGIKKYYDQTNLCDLYFSLAAL